jgi:unsaturated rhamnogalacturonyl hydrolase
MIDEKYRTAGMKMFRGIFKNSITYNSDGLYDIGNICLVAGLGGEQERDGSVEYYLSEPVVKNDAKGIAPLLMLYNEIIL